MESAVTYPVPLLREHTTALEAALSVCLADPGHKPVHKLRTATRRVEAQLILLGMVPSLPEHRKEAEKLLRGLKKLRRAAGEVRDLDVHRKMLDELAGEDGEGQNGAKATKSDGPGKKAAAKRQSAKGADRDGSAAQAANADAIRQAAADLRRRLGDRRNDAAVALQDLLKKRQVKVARAAEGLLKVLEPAQEVALPREELLRDAEAVLERDRLLEDGDVDGLSEDELHTLRKAAKAARYLAETLPEDALLKGAAERFESLQEAGGQWHDALQLARTARRYFGKGHELTAAYREQRDQMLAAYRKALAARLQPEQKGKGPKGHAGRKASGKKRAAV